MSEKSPYQELPLTGDATPSDLQDQPDSKQMFEDVILENPDFDLSLLRNLPTF